MFFCNFAVMKRYLVISLKVLGILAAVLTVVVIAATIVIHTGWFQSWMKTKANDYLKETLRTHIEIDSVGFDIFGGDIRLFGLEIDDRQKRRMFDMDALEVHADVLPLLDSRVNISSIEIRGLKANLFKERPDTAANYQFVLDAFKKEKKAETKDEKAKKEKKSKKEISLQLDHLELSDINIRYNSSHYTLGLLSLSGAEYSGEQLEEIPREKLKLVIKDFETSWMGKTKKGPVKNFLKVSEVRSKFPQVMVKGLNFKTDNSKPRRNTGRPKRGWFDAGHLDIVSDLDLTLKHLGKDSIAVWLDRGVARDAATGIDIRDLRAKARIVGKQVHLRDIVVQQISTTLNIDTAYIRLPNKKKNPADSLMYYSTSVITGRTQLRDISRPFAPVLSHFTLPLNLRTRLVGDANGMRFTDVFVFTDDKLLTINASGFIKNLKDKYRLNVHFDVNKMTARGGIKAKIINQFVVKKFMMKQVDRLGTIGYIGSFDVLWKREIFRGLLTSPHGNMSFTFQVDDLNKYLSGSVKSNSLALGKIMDMPDVGNVGASADFRFDISKPRTAKMRRIKGGKLPIGHINADIMQASYKFIKVKNMQVTIDSDGALATGHLFSPGKYVDLGCDFTFTNTDEMKKTKIKPKMSIHSGKSKEERDKIKAEKEAKKQAKQAEKDAKKAEKEKRKAEKAAAKAAKKAEKEAAKAAKAAKIEEN